MSYKTVWPSSKSAIPELDLALALSDHSYIPGGSIADELTVMATARKREKWKHGRPGQCEIERTQSSRSSATPLDPRRMWMAYLLIFLCVVDYTSALPPFIRIGKTILPHLING